MSKSNGKKRKQKQCTLNFTVVLNADEDTNIGKLIDFLNDNSKSEKSRIAINTLEARFLPLLLDRDDPNSEIYALDCLGKLDGFRQAIINYYGLTAAPPQAYAVDSSKRPEIHQDLPANENQISSNDRNEVKATNDLKAKRQGRLDTFN